MAAQPAVRSPSPGSSTTAARMHGSSGNTRLLELEHPAGVLLIDQHVPWPRGSR